MILESKVFNDTSPSDLAQQLNDYLSSVKKPQVLFLSHSSCYHTENNEVYFSVAVLVSHITHNRIRVASTDEE